ncbi:MAG: type II toxin-antitoxin system HipA family toxin [Fibrobacterota bacterium]|nr:type II toxin-antitoxin system HipA family toxin [Fibrobacterota bacterium]
MVSVARVLLWEKPVGAVLWDDKRGAASFEFEPGFLKLELDIAPIKMPLAEMGKRGRIFTFPALATETYKGLPGLLADSLPDRFGNSLIDNWLAMQGRDPASVNPVERLCYMGTRGMGALEFQPAQHPADRNKSNLLEISELVSLAKEALAQRRTMKASLKKKRAANLAEIIKVGTSAGGARAKAIIAYNEKNGAVQSGQVKAPKGFTHWLIKFDGVTNAKLGDPKGFGRIEYAYHKMAVACGITMTQCRLLEENHRAHFMTQRFDRAGNAKLHMQTLCALAHFDYNDPNAYSYEQAFQVMREMRLPYPDAKQLYTRMVFNVVARNQDDHTKNISFLMDNKGTWRLSPAYDITNAHDPGNKWMSRHQMSVNGKRDKFTRADLMAVAKEMNIKKPGEIIESVVSAVGDWPIYAKEAGVEKGQVTAIGKQSRIKL